MGVYLQDDVELCDRLDLIVGGRFTWPEAFVTIADDQPHLSPGDERDTQRIPPGGTPGYAVWTVRGGAELCRAARATLAIENFTDRDYRVHGSGQNEAGVNVVAAMDVRF